MTEKEGAEVLGTTSGDKMSEALARLRQVALRRIESHVLPEWWAITRTAIGTVALMLLTAAVASRPGFSQSAAELEKFFRQDIGLSEEQIAAIRSGQPVATPLPPRTPAEVLLFGAIYIHAAPETYFQRGRNFDRLRKVPGFLALGIFTDPPQLSDLQGFTLDSQEIEDLKNCKPGDCMIQMPATSIEALHQSVDWGASDVDEQLNSLLQRTALELVVAYQREGNTALGVYNDKRDPTAVPEQFAYLLSFCRTLSDREPDFYHYLLAYPRAKPASYEDTFYWAKVKFGLKPTLRVVHMVTMRGGPADPVANAIARKQLYSSHYFEAGLELSVSVREGYAPKQAGFYLIQSMGSEQAGLSGVKGSIVRKAAVGRAVSNLQRALVAIKSDLEGSP